MANAATAHGDADLPPATNPRRYLVVGGGPAGLRGGAAARLQGPRGRAGRSRRRELGGTLVAAGHTDPVLAQFVSWMRAEIERSPVELRLSTSVTPEVVDELNVDEVVVATGGSWSRPDVPISAGTRVRGVDEITGWLEADDGSIERNVVVARR